MSEGLRKLLEKAARAKLVSDEYEGMYVTGTGAGIRNYRDLKQALLDQKHRKVGSLSIRTATGALWIDWDKDPRFLRIRHVTSEQSMHNILPPPRKIRAYPLFSIEQPSERGGEE
jgi:hypothetical protein